MSKCPDCGFLLKNEYTCDLCGKIIKEEETEVYQIPRKSEKQKEITRKDIEFFWEIWNERPHICEVSGQPLGEEFNVCFFSHVLVKKNYKRFRWYKKNIVLCTYDWHQAWEFGDRKEVELQWVKLLHEFLKQEYYNSK